MLYHLPFSSFFLQTLHRTRNDPMTPIDRSNRVPPATPFCSSGVSVRLQRSHTSSLRSIFKVSLSYLWGKCVTYGHIGINSAYSRRNTSRMNTLVVGLYLHASLPTSPIPVLDSEKFQVVTTTIRAQNNCPKLWNL